MTTLYEFCRELPKVELHAHLNGSLSARTLSALQRLHADAGRSHETLFGEMNYNSGDSRTLSDCFRVFNAAHALTATAEALALAARLTAQEFRDNGCAYLELRSTPRATPHMTRAQYVDALLQAVRESSDDNILVKYIVSIDRRWPQATVDEVIDLAVEYHARHPEWVVGVELSGDPTRGKFSDFVPAFTRARNAGLKISLHFGEVSHAAEALEMLAFAPERLGHAVHAPWPELLASRIPVEVCLSSNVKTRSVASYDEHHFLKLYEARHPLAICTDDAGVFATSLAHEYAVCGETFALGRARLARLALDACTLAFAAPDVRRRLAGRVAAFVERHGLGRDLGESPDPVGK